ncbi:MAG: MORN repeat-containing protein [bacterium]
MEWIKLKLKKDKGAALILTILLIIFLGVITTALTSGILFSLQHYEGLSGNKLAYYVAESGIEYAKHVLATEGFPETFDSTQRFPLLNGGYFVLTFEKVNASVVTVESVGYYKEYQYKASFNEDIEVDFEGITFESIDNAMVSDNNIYFYGDTQLKHGNIISNKSIYALSSFNITNGQVGVVESVAGINESDLMNYYGQVEIPEINWESVAENYDETIEIKCRGGNQAQVEHNNYFFAEYVKKDIINFLRSFLTSKALAAPRNERYFDRIYENGYLVYEGYLLNGKYDGQGVLYDQNGRVRYTGDWEKGEYHGEGKLYDQNGRLRYDGEWQKGEYHGYGIERDQNGYLRYEGEWENNLYDGYGKYYDQNGRLRYDGEWQNGEEHGYGLSYDQNGNFEYEGEWRSGQQAPNGDGENGNNDEESDSGTGCTIDLKHNLKYYFSNDLAVNQDVVISGNGVLYIDGDLKINGDATLGKGNDALTIITRGSLEITGETKLSSTIISEGTSRFKGRVDGKGGIIAKGQIDFENSVNINHKPIENNITEIVHNYKIIDWK